MGAYLAAPKTEKVSVNDSLGDISYGASCMQGWRVTMEDAHCCLLDFDEKASLFGVYDGHGGSEVAEYVAKHLAKEILSTENYKKGSLKQSLIDAFLGIDQKIISEEGMNELKELAGMNDMSDADEDETELLSKEAEMPIEQLLSKLKQQGYEAIGRPVDMIAEDDSEEEVEEDSDDYSDEEDDEGTGGEGEEGEGEGDEDGEEQPAKQEQNGEVISSATDVNEKGKEVTPKTEDSNNKSETNDAQKNENDKEITTDAKNSGEEKTDSASENQQKEHNKESDGKEEIEDGEIAGIQEEVDGEEDEGVDDEDDEQVMPHSDEVGYDSGTTAIVALLKDKQLVVANVGDSRCVLCRSGVALDMSLDHKPDDDKELNRIENAGGKVTCEGRVNGGLNLSRALGDHSYKLKSELAAHEQMISAFPDVRETTITESDEFMVIACDGIWNVMSSQEVVDFVADRLKKQKSKGQANLTIICEELFDACLAPDTSGDGSGCDNMTCVIVLFKPQQASNTDTARTGKRKGDEIENCEDNEQSSKRVKSDD